MTNKMTAGKRLHELIKGKGKSVLQFSKEVPVTRSTISTFITGKTKPHEDTIVIFCRYFNVNVLWLMEGLGEKKADDLTVVRSVEEKTLKPMVRDTSDKNSNYINSPIVNKVSEQRFIDSIIMKKPFVPNELYPFYCSGVVINNDCFTFFAKDSSMEPEIPKGSVVVAQKIDRKLYTQEVLSSSRLYVVVLQNSIIVRQLRSVGDTDISFEASNNNFVPITLGINKCSLLLKVLFVGRSYE